MYALPWALCILHWTVVYRHYETLNTCKAKVVRQEQVLAMDLRPVLTFCWAIRMQVICYRDPHLNRQQDTTAYDAC
jgi:hypothetical protein